MPPKTYGGLKLLYIIYRVIHLTVLNLLFQQFSKKYISIFTLFFFIFHFFQLRRVFIISHSETRHFLEIFDLIKSILYDYKYLKFRQVKWRYTAVDIPQMLV